MTLRKVLATGVLTLSLAAPVGAAPVPWVLSVFVQPPPTACAAPAMVCPGPGATLAFSQPFPNRRDCTDAARAFSAPSADSCPSNAVCSRPILPEDTIVSKLCTFGYTGSN
jgi:hypothetical protein